METKIEPFLAEHIKLLRVVLDAGDRAQKLRKGLHPLVAGCNHGSYERVDWVNLCANELPESDDVRIVKPNELTNYLRVKVGDKYLDFSMFFGRMVSETRYYIHNKGKHADRRSSMQMTLPGLDVPVAEGKSFFPYALPIKMGNEIKSWMELHLILGSRPKRNGIMTDGIEAYERYVVRMEDEMPVTVEAYDPTFSPDVIA